jgi:hypothetical protein
VRTHDQTSIAARKQLKKLAFIKKEKTRNSFLFYFDFQSQIKEK